MNEIPAGWEALTVGDLLARRPKNGTSPVAADHFTGAYILGLGCLTKQGFAPTQLKNAPPWRAAWSASELHAGDLLITRANTRELVGMVGRYRDVGARCIYPDLMMRLSPNSRVLPGFLECLLRSDTTRRQIQSSASGTSESMVKISASIVMSLSVNLPPLDVQRKIAEILDTVDEAIRSTERLIAKSRYIAEATASALLLDGDNSLQWDVLPLESVSSIRGGVTLGRAIPMSRSVELPYLRVANVQDGYIDLNKIKTVRILTSEIDRFALQPGDVLMTEGGDFDKLGRGAVWDGEISPCLHQNHIFRVRCDQEVMLPGFLAAYSRSHKGRRYFLECAKQTTNLASINMTQLSQYPVPVPPLETQRFIVQTLRSVIESVSARQSELEKLREVKRGLVEDLLTGRVRAKVD